MSGHRPWDTVLLQLALRPTCSRDQHDCAAYNMPAPQGQTAPAWSYQCLTHSGLALVVCSAVAASYPAA